jgi:hypothetical protein
MRLKVDYLLVGTGAAPLLAAQRLTQRGDTVVIVNPDPDFFLENSELPLDLLSFESTNTDLSQRFTNNLPENVYKDLIPEFPGALEMSREENEHQPREFQVEGAPWIRFRHRLWMAPADGGKGQEKMESLYLRALDLGWKPKWLEGVSLAKRFPGFSARKLEERDVERWNGFLGPRFGDIDVARYRMGLLEYVREKLGREHILTATRVVDLSKKGATVQGSHGQPVLIEVDRAVLQFWTPKMERPLRQSLQKHAPRTLSLFDEAVTRQLWEEWDLLSRDPVNPYVVANLEGIRLWSFGEGPPPPGGYSRIKVMRRERSTTLLGDQSFQELFKLVFGFMGWDRFTVRSMSPRVIYRWKSTTPIEYDADGLTIKIIQGCDGPLHWIASQVRKAIDGV